MINQIQKANDYAEKIMAEQFGVEIQFLGTSDIGIHKATFEEMRGIFLADGKISWFKKICDIFNKKYTPALSSFTINGKQANSAKDCEIILQCIELDKENQESIVLKWIPQFQKYLNWY